MIGSRDDGNRNKKISAKTNQDKMTDNLVDRLRCYVMWLEGAKK